MVDSQAVGSARISGARAALVAGCAGAVYGLIVLAVARTQPLGQMAVLDGREILDLALHLARGDAEPAPFYRAPLYPFVLSLPLRAGLPFGLLLPAAQILNILCHALSAALVALIAGRLWQSVPAALAAGLLFGLYPVAVFFAAEPLDMSLSITLMLTAAWIWIRAWQSGSAPGAGLVVAGLVVVAAFSARPQMLTIAAGMLTAAVLLGPHRVKMARGLAVGLALGLALFGLANRWVGGEFLILPTQGGYNLWAANGPEANGRYFVQTVNSFGLELRENPNRFEAAYRYRQANNLPSDAPVNDRAVSAYWSGRTVDYILDQPADWLGLVVVKAAALIHNHEQYNNKTYAFHRDRNPALRLNPLSWGPLLALAIAGGLLGRDSRRGVAAVGILAAAYAGGLLLSYVSARFRLPLAALLCLLAGGLATLKPATLRRRPRTLVAALSSGLAVTVFAFWPFGWADPQSTDSEDWLLLASAQARQGRSQEALASVQAVLDRDGDHAKALHLHCSISFNEWMDAWMAGRGGKPSARLLESCGRAAEETRASRWAWGMVCWLDGQHEKAVEVWRNLARGGDVNGQRALASLVFAGQANRDEIDQVATIPYNRRVELLLFAGERLNDPGAGRYLDSRFVPDWLARQRAFYRHLFPPQVQGDPSD